MLCLLAIAAPTTCAEPVRMIYYSGATLPTDKRADYYLKLLNLVLGKAGIRYELRPNPTLMATKRAMERMGSNGGIDVFWGPTTKEMEQNFLAIRVPIDKGILGWRIFLINPRDRPLFDAVHSLRLLQSYSAGQQRDWADTAILRANGLTVVGTDSYETMFAMLAANRFQYFPRGIGEIWAEANSHPGFEVEQHLALHYPAYTYFFVSKTNIALAQQIEKGLHSAMADGSLNKLFEQFNGEAIKRAHLNARTVFELSNPDLPDTPPLPGLSDPIHP